MRRRRTLIDDYLKAHDPVATHTQRAAQTERAVIDAGPPRWRWRWPSVAVLAMATAAVIAVVAFMPGRATNVTDTFLSPEAAVAAASNELEREGILHWTSRDGSVPTAQGSGVVEQWLDMRTLASHTLYPNGRTAAGLQVQRAWYNGKRTFRFEEPAGFVVGDPRKVIKRNVRRRGEPLIPAVQTDPIAKLRELLAAAARGEATLEAAPDEGGVPVVKVKKRTRSEEGLHTATTWMTRQEPPRQLRTTSEFKPSKRFLRDASPARRREIPRFSTYTMHFDTWELLPRTPANIAKVQPPEFDPKEYKVVTQFLGPYKR